MSLFQDSEFTAASSIRLPFKIDCDALTDEDLACLAAHACSNVVSMMFFKRIIPVPTGGNRFAEALRPHLLESSNAQDSLIVDDVWTTGTSVLRVATVNNLLEHLGSRTKALVLFARGSYPRWVYPLMTLHPNLRLRGSIWNADT